MKRCLKCGYYYENDEHDKHELSNEHLIGMKLRIYNDCDKLKKIYYKCDVCYSYYMPHHYLLHLKTSTHSRHLNKTKTKREKKTKENINIKKIEKEINYPDKIILF